MCCRLGLASKRQGLPSTRRTSPYVRRRKDLTSPLTRHTGDEHQPSSWLPTPTSKLTAMNLIIHHGFNTQPENWACRPLTRPLSSDNTPTWSDGTRLVSSITILTVRDLLSSYNISPWQIPITVDGYVGIKSIPSSPIAHLNQRPQVHSTAQATQLTSLLLPIPICVAKPQCRLLLVDDMHRKEKVKAKE